MNKNNQTAALDFVVCYVTADGSRRFTNYVDPNYRRNGEIDVSTFEATHPDTHVTAVFSTGDNMFDICAQEKTKFIDTCRNYGFEPEDYHRLVSDRYGYPKYLFAGFLPRNTKYKALLFNKETGNYTKATLGFVERHMIFSPEEV